TSGAATSSSRSCFLWNQEPQPEIRLAPRISTAHVKGRRNRRSPGSAKNQFVPVTLKTPPPVCDVQARALCAPVEPETRLLPLGFTQVFARPARLPRKFRVSRRRLAAKPLIMVFFCPRHAIRRGVRQPYEWTCNHDLAAQMEVIDELTSRSAPLGGEIRSGE